MTKPIRHLVPLGAENKWSDLVATLIELDPDPVAELLGLGDSSAHVSVEREVPAGSGGRVDLLISVDNEKRCVAEAKVLSGLGLDQLRRYRDHFPDVPHHVLITLEHFPIDVPNSAGWRSVRWEDLLRALSGSTVPLVAETASTWLSYVDGEMPRLSASTRWNDLRDGEGFVICQWPFVLPHRRPGVLPAGGHPDLPNGGQIVPRLGLGLGQLNGITPLPEVA